MDALQNIIVALLVSGCTLYAAWKLMPATARRALAASLLRLPHLPRAVEAGLRKSATGASGCGCDGCDRADKRPTARPPATQTIRFHARRRR